MLTELDRATYGNEDESRGICHVPSTGEPDTVWWLGFDCHHAWDLAPLDVKNAEDYGYTLRGDEDYRTLDYVKRECASLAKQVTDTHGLINY